MRSKAKKRSYERERVDQVNGEDASICGSVGSGGQGKGLARTDRERRSQNRRISLANAESALRSSALITNLTNTYRLVLQVSSAARQLCAVP